MSILHFNTPKEPPQFFWDDYDSESDDKNTSKPPKDDNVSRGPLERRRIVRDEDDFCR